MAVAVIPSVEPAREAFTRGEWGAAYEQLTAAHAGSVLRGDDIHRLATAAYLTGHDDDSRSAFAQAHDALLNEGDIRGSARCAFWLGMLLFQRGQAAPAIGWVARARRVLESEPLCAEHGILLVFEGRGALESGNAEGAREIFTRMGDIADQFKDAELAAMSHLGLGEAHVLAGDVAAGLQLHDEAMAAVQAGDVSPILAGIVYCAVIGACHMVHDVRRAQQWTSALTAWCEEHPDLVPFRGNCLVHRAQILRFQGAWVDALEAAREAVTRFSDTPWDPAVGAAYYEQGELHRLRGEAAAAEDAYRRASESGYIPQPGLALLRMQQGDLGAARKTIRRAVDEEHLQARRFELLVAAVEVDLRDGDAAAARPAVEEAAAIARGFNVPVLDAGVSHMSGAVALAQGDVREALPLARQAWLAWRDLGSPYDAARARVLVGAACHRLGDDDGADLEFEAARKTFTDLGAGPQLAQLDEVSRPQSSPRPGGLTDRELEVLRLVASGGTNRDIAQQLVLSEHTVARHVQNIFTKLGVGSRTAAANFAFEHGLLGPSSRGEF